MHDSKIAIHNIPLSASERWIEYCQQKDIPYKLVDCNRSDIIEQLKDCDGLMWHWGQSDYKFQLFARQLTYSLEKKGIKVFPNSATCWHFDDKVGQKYLLESLNLPLVKSYIFYTKQEALEWVEKTSFPKVFKLKGGAGSVNVSLVRDKQQAVRKINTAFNKGFPAYSSQVIFNEKIRKFFVKKDLKSFTQILKSSIRLISPGKRMNLLSREKGYVYFQEFIPNNKCDIRLVVIGERCFGIRRFVRKNDFRASGSGLVDDNPDNININFVKKAFEIGKKLGVQSVAFDFLDDNNVEKLAEISYAFPVLPSDGIPGYWDSQLNWHEGVFKSQYWMIENFLEEIQKSKNSK